MTTVCPALPCYHGRFDEIPALLLIEFFFALSAGSDTLMGTCAQ